MEHFLEVIKKFLSNIVINPGDSDTDRAKKIIWYSFFVSIVAIVLISWILFVLLTFTADVVKVPNVEKDHIYTALEKLSEKRLVARVLARPTESYPEGIVYEQSPGPGTNVKAGRLVTVFVSKGKSENLLDDYTQLNYFEVLESMKNRFPNGKLPFKLKTPVYEFNESVEKGNVIRQEPVMGTPLKSMKSLQLWVSNGKKSGEQKVLPDFTGKKIDDVSAELFSFEIPYSFEFLITDNKDKDLVVAEQSIGGGAVIADILRDGQVLILKINLYKEIENEKISGTHLVTLPKKPLPYQFEVKIIFTDLKEKSLLKMSTKGGVSIGVPYTSNKKNKLAVFIDGQLSYKIDLENETGIKSEETGDTTSDQ